VKLGYRTYHYQIWAVWDEPTAFHDMTASILDQYTNEEFPRGAVDAEVLVEGSVVGEVTLLVDGDRLTIWGDGPRCWANDALLAFLREAEGKHEGFNRGAQISELVGAVNSAQGADD